jgi:hypothetical protein
MTARRTWPIILAQLGHPTPNPSSPILSAPKAWAAVDAELGTSALPLFVAARLSDFRQRIAVELVDALIAAAAAIEPALPTLGSSETAARVIWASDLAAINALVADVDGGASAGATAQQLTDRIATAKRSASTLATGKAALLNALRVPAEPGLDVSFRSALAAVKFFFT